MLSSKTGEAIQEDLIQIYARPRPELHAIALRYAFEFLVPPTGTLSYSFSFGPRSAWLEMIRTLKSVALVCKSWNAAMLPVLYGDVVLRRAGQLVAFAKTLLSAPQMFARHLCRLTLYFFVPEGWTTLTRRLLARVMNASPGLSALSVQGHFPAATILCPSANTDALSDDTFETHARCFQRLSHMDIYGTISYPQLGAHESFLPPGAYANITSLSLFVGNNVDPGWESSVQFLNLTTLVLRAHASYFGTTEETYRLPRSWDLPRLEALRLRLEYGNPAPDSLTAVAFVQKYVATLRNLAFSGSRTIPIAVQADAAALCPRLEHLVLEVSRTDGEADGRAASASLQASKAYHQQIALVDVVIHQKIPHDELLARPRVELAGSAWKHVRCIDGHTIYQVPDLPYLFPRPCLDPERTRSFTARFYGVQIEVAEDWIELASGWEELDKIYPPSDSGSESEESAGGSDGSDESIVGGDDDSDRSSSHASQDEMYMGSVDRKYRPSKGSGGSTSSSDESEPEEDSDDAEITEEEALAMFESTLDTE
ncbi:hypothetical protein PsYK624_053060 [Phanerochaete sordida]|uniref:F-box domain-containing protein n=1 Tax=Phanerochaete sordida TaxID=48140 RepID=A0A9P3G6K6_9APHY|nr:hypothetical protein PsYK624_053060 [Phanerochaete sordida]